MKKLISLLLVVIMCFGLVGCNYTETVKITENAIAKIYANFEVSEAELVLVENFIQANKGQKITIGEGKDAEEITLDDEYVEYFQEYLQSIRALKNIGTKEAPVYSYTMIETFSFEDGAQDFSSAGYSEVSTTEILAYSVNSNVWEGAFTDGDLSELSFLAQAVGVDFNYSTRFEMPYKVTRSNAEIIDEKTVEFNAEKLGNFLYIVTEKSTKDWAQAEDPKQVIVEQFKQRLMNTKAVKPYVYFNNKTSAYIEVFDNNFETHDLEYKEGNGKWKTPKFKKDGANYYIVKDLKANTKYQFRLKGYCESPDFGKVYGITSKAVTLDFSWLNKPKFTLESGKKSFKINMKKDYKGIWYYEVKYSKNKNMKNAKNFKFSSKIKTIKKLKADTTYYVKIRKVFAYNTKSDWTKVKTIKTK